MIWEFKIFKDKSKIYYDMAENIYKRKNEWKDMLNELSFEDFQYLCYDLVRNCDFRNPMLRGGGWTP